ncbi:MAG: NAD(P)H-hydrate dehydratase [Campylobacter sp.]
MKKLFLQSEFLDENARNLGLTSEILMENAAAKIENIVRKKLKKGSKILAVCGKGNNASDAICALRRLSGDFSCVALILWDKLNEICEKQLKIAQNYGVKAFKLVEIHEEICQITSLRTSAESDEFYKTTNSAKFAFSGAKIDKTSENFDPNLDEFLKTKGNLTQDFQEKKELDLTKFECIIDGIFGSGFHGEMPKIVADLITTINHADALKIAVDIPSGVSKTGAVLQSAFCADFTIAMGARKIALYADSAKDFVGRIKLANLGVCADIFARDMGEITDKISPNSSKNLEQISTNSKAIFREKSQILTNTNTPFCDTFLLQKRDLILPLRHKQNTNKGDFGHIFIALGQMNGAGIIASNASHAMGAGRVSLVKLPLQNDVRGAKNEPQIPPILMQKNSFKGADVIIAGCGLGEAKFDLNLLTNTRCVIDADLCYKSEILELLCGENGVIITPHPKEFCALLKNADIAEVSVREIQQNRFDFARKFSTKFHATLVLKGANTLIANKGEIYVMAHGTSALAKGGSGDALCGVIGAYLAQGFSPLSSAINGTLAHALAAKKALKKMRINDYALDANDIIKGLKWL